VRRNYYSYGSNAVEIEYLKDKASVKQALRQEKKEEALRRRSSIKKLLLMLVITLCCIFVVKGYSTVYDLKRENAGLRLELDEQIYLTGTIEAQITNSVDASYIEYYAINYLNMAKPQQYQIVYIDVPKTDYTVHREASLIRREERVSAWSSFRGFLPW
jgi:cell division protein FtsB